MVNKWIAVKSINHFLNNAFIYKSIAISFGNAILNTAFERIVISSVIGYHQTNHMQMYERMRRWYPV